MKNRPELNALAQQLFNVYQRAHQLGLEQIEITYPQLNNDNQRIKLNLQWELYYTKQPQTKHDEQCSEKPHATSQCNIALGWELFKKLQLADAEAAFNKAITLDSANGEAYYGLGVVLHELGRLKEAETALRKALQHHRKADIYHRLAKMLREQGRLTDAQEIIQEAILKLPQKDSTSFQEVLSRVQLNLSLYDKINKSYQTTANTETLFLKEGSDFQTETAIIQGGFFPTKSSWPILEDLYGVKRYLDVLDRYVFNLLPQIEKRPLTNTTILAFGSCFAANITAALLEHGAKASTARLEEEVNSTYAIRYLLEYLAYNVENSLASEVRRFYGDLLDVFKRNITIADEVILTIGVAPCLFHTADKTFFFSTDKIMTRKMIMEGKLFMRTTGFEENIENIRSILTSLKEINKNARIFITLSPVPLRGTIEPMSSIEADCVSKSTLRTAIFQLQQAKENFIYWPAFEAIKWLASHSNVIAFGRQDGRTRHPSDWLVNYIIKQFLAYGFLQ